MDSQGAGGECACPGRGSLLMSPRQIVHRLMAKLNIERSLRLHFVNELVEMVDEIQEQFYARREAGIEEVEEEGEATSNENCPLLVTVHKFKEYEAKVDATKLLLKNTLEEVKGQQRANDSSWIYFTCHKEVNFVIESDSEGVSLTTAIDPKSNPQSIDENEFHVEVEPQNPESFRIISKKNAIQIELKYPDSEKTIQVMADNYRMLQYVKIGRNPANGKLFIKCQSYKNLPQKPQSKTHRRKVAKLN